MIKTAFIIFILATVTFKFADAHAANQIARDTYLIEGSYVLGEQPDGNSILLTTSKGIVVVDTGRHLSHTRKLIEFAHERHLDIQAIVNTHWHLDHIGGNALLRVEYPHVKVYASDALQEALHGFLADYRRYLEDALAKEQRDADALTSLRAELAILDSASALAPNEIVASSGVRIIAGRKLEVRLEHHAATAGDIWLFDRATGVVIAGDLVTLPAPFLDTACPARWEQSLQHLAAIDFKLLVPGHGAPMSRSQFAVYRNAFVALRACAASNRSDATCVAGWLNDAATLLNETDRRAANSLVDYYLKTSLRSAPAQQKFCS